MLRMLLLSYLALLLTLLPACLPRFIPPAETADTDAASAVCPLPAAVGSPAAETVLLRLPSGGVCEMDMQEYLLGVVAAEMPAAFEPQALRAQAVAARTYALYCAAARKHGEADVCTEPGCCQAYAADSVLRLNWGEAYETNAARIRAAVEATDGEYLSYGGAPVFAAFHSSSAGATEDCGAVWNARPYLISVSSPETAEQVPNYQSSVRIWRLDFRDTLLRAHPECDFSGEAEGWIGETERDASGRVAAVTLGGVRIRGTELRQLFALRSTAFTLSYAGGIFTFSVTGFGHGVGMSQYGANTLAASGWDYRAILAHYYPGTALVTAQQE